MEMLSALLAHCEANEPITSDFLHKGLVIWSFDVFSLLAWTNYLTNRQVALDQISVSLR